MDAQLKAWDAEIKTLKAKALNAKADAKIEYEKQSATLEAKRTEASRKLQEIKASSADAWDSLKDGAEKAFDDMRGAVKSALAKFN